MPLRKIPSDRLHDVLGGAEMRVKYKDVFDLKEFYKALREWLQEHNWVATDGKTTFWETYYGERLDMKGTKEIWIRWRLTKNAVDTPLKYYLDYDWHCLGLTQVEVVKDGNKLKLDKGEAEIKIKAFLEEAYKSDFEQNPLLKPFAKMFAGRIYKDERERREKELYQEVYEMQNFMKQWFKLKRYLPYEETPLFFKSRAWPSHIQGEK